MPVNAQNAHSGTSNCGFQVEYARAACKDVEGLDYKAARRIRSLLENRLAGLEDSRSPGEALKGSRPGEFWKYRVGDYRIIASIEDETVTVRVMRIGHRRELHR